MTRDPKLWAALAYVFGLISGITVLLMEKEDRYVRFHAMQSVLTFGAIAVLWVLLPTVPIVGDLRVLLGMYWAGVLALWALLMWKALQGEAYRLPYIGDIAHSMTH
jgi:uncharacterized membrane protein